MEDTWKVSSKLWWQFLGYWWRSLSLDPIPFEQHWEQLCILHGNWIKFCSWSLLLWIELLKSRLLRLLLILLLILWKLMLITRILNIIGNGHNSGNRVINWILLLRQTFHHTHLLIFVLKIVSGNIFFDQTSFLDPLFNTRTHSQHPCKVAGCTCNHMLFIKLI